MNFPWFHMTAHIPADIRQCFQVLGLDLDADARQAKLAYRRLVKRWHPDLFSRHPVDRPLGEERIREINAAFAVVRRVLDSRRGPTGAVEAAEHHRKPGWISQVQDGGPKLPRLRNPLKPLFQTGKSESQRRTCLVAGRYFEPEPRRGGAAAGSFEAELQACIREKDLHEDRMNR